MITEADVKYKSTVDLQELVIAARKELARRREAELASLSPEERLRKQIEEDDQKIGF